MIRNPFRLATAVQAASHHDSVSVEDASFETMDSLWRTAEGLGRIEVDRPMLESVYRVRIRFKRASGTLVWAEGSNQNILFAMSDAIREAKSLGAKAEGAQQ